jgi:transcriptional regulator with XRE-family HTH domain
MDGIGPQIEAVRKRRVWSRELLAEKLGVTSQTVFNLERVPTYNLTTSMMRRLELVLQVRFTITMTEEISDMAMPRIIMGSDEMILMIRKHNATCGRGNRDLGKRIWEWLESRGGRIAQEDAPSYWGDQGAFIDEMKLPKTAAQIEFDAYLLPPLYDFLMSL